MKIALILVVLLAAKEGGPRLETRAFPSVSLEGSNGCGPVLLVAEIKGPEVEEWYCPKVEWEMPDGTRATEESDCDPFADRTDYPHRWTRRICAPAHPTGDAWTVVVTLSKSGKTIAHQEIRFIVKG